MKKPQPGASQFETFVEASRKLGADESEEKFDQALKRVGRAKLVHPPRPKKEASKPGETDELE